jgi:hypothetical protein
MKERDSIGCADNVVESVLASTSFGIATVLEEIE